jgi:hypothetical protein
MRSEATLLLGCEESKRSLKQWEMPVDDPLTIGGPGSGTADIAGLTARRRRCPQKGTW